MPALAYLSASTPLRMASAGAAAAIPILAVQRLDDVAIGGFLVGASLAPSIVVAPLAGVALDRARHPRALIAGAGLVTAAMFVVAAFLGPLPAGVVALALAVSGAATPFYFGGLSSFVTQAIADESRAYSADALSYNIGSVAGPAVAAVAVGAGSAQAAMFALAATALVGSVAMGGLRLAPHSDAGAERPRVWRQIGTGLAYLAGHRPIAVVTASGTLSQLGGGALPIAALAISAQRSGTPVHAAWFITAFAVGALAGTLLATAVPASRIPPEWRMGVGFAATGLVLLAATPDAGLAAALGLIGVAGVFTAHSTAPMLLLRTQQSPARLRSQVFTVGSALRTTAAAAGAAIAGLLASASVELQLGAIAVVWVLSGVLMLAYPRRAAPVADS
ncbi:MAG: hypothetical protein HY996_01165 [Micrococcales bacterium]|nr:hypothetical protein [Micrococcales bacterium]